MKLSQVKQIIVAFAFSIISSQVLAVYINPPSILYASVNPLTNDITVAWQKSPEPIVDSLVLFYVPNPANPAGNPIKSFQNKTETYSFNVTELGMTSVASQLSFDADVFTGGNKSASLDHSHTTVFASSSFQICPSRNVVSWTAYHGLQTGTKTPLQITRYTVYQYINGNSIAIDSVLGNVLSLSIPINNGAGDYSYYVETEFIDINGNTEKSTSNMTKVTAILPKYPSFITGNYTQAISNDSLLLSFSVDLTSDISHFQVYKSDTLPGLFTALTSGNITKAAKQDLIIYDTTNAVSLHHNYYKIAAVDACGDTVLSSNIISNIVAYAKKSDNSNVISWNSFIQWQNGVEQYDLYRSIDGEDAYVVYSETKVNGKSFTYTDNLNGVSGNGSEQCYYAIAIPAGVKNVSIKSISNKVCIKQEDKLFIPDAFNPLSKIDANKTFRPIVAYINTSTYKFTIFNRLSEPIFQTSDINKAWDGTVKGEMVAEGTYIYDVKYKNSDGKSIEKRGTFYVVFNEK